MPLPFTREQFFDLFAAYNEALWPAAAALWIVSAVVVGLRLSARRPHDRWISALLAGHWAWSALAYHAAYFTRINPAAWLFAALFLGQAVLFFRVGFVQRRLSFAPWGNAWAPPAWGLIAYSLAYPAINAIDYLSLSRIPTFGVPCPTTIFTAGVLMLATPRSWRLSTVPVIWSAIGGSAAFLLGVYADVALPMAGMALAIFSVRRTTPEQLRAGEGSGRAMKTTTLETKVHDFLAQKRIAVAGVSRNNSHHPVGNLIYERLKKTGHDVFPVNPHMQTFEGDRCYPDLQSIPGGVDGVVIITRPETTERIVRDCSDAGVHRVWMHQSLGKGSSVSPVAVEYCGQHDISVIAGACPMMYGEGADFGHTCMRWMLRLTGGLPT